MKRLAPFVLALALAASAEAQAPTVNGNTGDLGLVYRFELALLGTQRLGEGSHNQ